MSKNTKKVKKIKKKKRKKEKKLDTRRDTKIKILVSPRLFFFLSQKVEKIYNGQHTHARLRNPRVFL